MKRNLCLLLALLLLVSLGVQAFADYDVLYCRMCGRQIPTDSRVCPYCGEKVVHVDGGAVKAAAAPAEVPAAAPAEVPAAVPAEVPAAVPTATDVKTALAQSSAPSPVTAAAVPGPFNTTLGVNGSSGLVRVTKSPTSESVPYGGACSFIAHAVNATSVTWYLSNANMSVITTAAEASNSVPGLYVSGANTDTLSLSGIPSWMNGCQVQACFTGEGGPVYSDVARIWTYEEAAPASSDSGWNWWDWYKYAYWNDPYAWENPWWLDWDDTPNPPDVRRAITLPDGRSIAPDMSDWQARHVRESEAIQIGHYNPLHPEDSWYDPSGSHGHTGPGTLPPHIILPSS